MSQAVAKLGEEIIEEAKAEAQRRLAKAEEEAKKIVEAARAEAGRLVEEAKAKAVEEVSLIERRRLSEARRKAALKILEEKNKLVAEAFKKAYSQLKNLKFEAYSQSITRLLEASIPSIASEEVQVWLNKRDLERQNRLLKNVKLPKGVKLTVAEKPLETIGGFVLTSPDGKIKLDQTFEVRLQHVEKLLRKELSKILFA
ncbi:MAG: archaeal A1A0-type ATP synthase, subunit E [Candidatus Hecatellales archaeon B24]|nr:MAG: archaeal A1A0-type ATP synthase, subunit E [Candidatus Hecatellales archaeon B24]